MAVIIFNGTEIQCPSAKQYEGQQLVNSSRNAKGEVVAQKVNRRQVKLSLSWSVIYPDEVKKITNLIEQFAGEVKFYDLRTGEFITRQMYWGDYSIEDYMVDSTGKPIFFTNFKTSLIDMGLED